MANRDFKNFQAAEREVKRLYMKATIGATGAPTLVAADSLGIKSIVRNTTGDYTVTFGAPSGLTDSYSKLLWADGKLLDPDAEDVRVNIDSDLVHASNPFPGIVKILTLTGGSATDPSDGATLLMVFDVKNSSVK
jgi:hypothetical protein